MHLHFFRRQTQKLGEPPLHLINHEITFFL